MRVKANLLLNTAAMETPLPNVSWERTPSPIVNRAVICTFAICCVSVALRLTKVNSTPSAAACKVTVLSATVIAGIVTNTPPRAKFVIVCTTVLRVAA